jgi:gliding motility-associated-like protein
MNRFLIIISLLLFKLSTFGQITLYQENFENTISGWTSYGDLSPNYWITGVCAGNGPNAAGQTSMYVTFGGTFPGCGPGGTSNYGYNNSDNGGTKSVIYAHVIQASCASNLNISYNQLLTVDGVDDFAEMVYSTDNGLSWTVVGSILSSDNLWQNISTNLPSSLDFTDFLLGFRFTYNETTIGQKPLAIDNVIVTGTDSENPTIICPTAQNIYTNSSCSALVGDYISIVNAADNCTAFGDLTFTQSPLPGTNISTNTNIQITVVDLSGNTNNCNFTLNALDTISPTIACQDSITVNVNASCQFLVPDLTSTLAYNDNCTTNSNLVFTQTPIAGSTATGFTTVLVTITDESGNEVSCSTVLKPNDTQAPNITCPQDITLQNGTICSYTITDFTTQVIVVESCPNYTIQQSPPVDLEIGTGSHTVGFLVTDASGNSSTCTFTLNIIESIPPTFTNCPSNIISCDPLVSYSEIFGLDNCATIVIQQTDNSGLTSGSNFPLGITPQQYTVTDLSGNTAVCNFNVEVYSYPSDAIISLDSAEICSNLTYNLVANPITSGNGSWSQITSSSTIANPASPTTSVSNFTPGINTYVWTVSTQNCGVKKDTIFLTVYGQPTIANIQSDSVYICSAASTLLLGSFPTVGNPMWTTLEGATIVSPNQHNTVANTMAPGWNTFIYTISNGNCVATSDTLNVYSNNLALIQTNDTTVCITDIFEINAEIPVLSQTSAWYFIKGKGDILSPNSPTSLVDNIVAGENIIVYRLTHPVCGFSHDTLIVTVNNCTGEEFIFPTVITPNADGKNDAFMIDNLNVLYPNCEVIIVNRWGTVVFESVGYNTPWNGTFKGEELPMGTYYYKILLNDSEKNIYTGPISIIR